MLIYSYYIDSYSYYIDRCINNIIIIRIIKSLFYNYNIYFIIYNLFIIRMSKFSTEMRLESFTFFTVVCHIYLWESQCNQGRRVGVITSRRCTLRWLQLAFNLLFAKLQKKMPNEMKNAIKKIREYFAQVIFDGISRRRISRVCGIPPPPSIIILLVIDNNSAVILLKNKPNPLNSGIRIYDTVTSN